MKREVTLVLLIIMLCALCACNSVESPEPIVPEIDGTISDTPSRETYTEAETIALEHFKVLLEAIEADRSGYFTEVSHGTDAYKAIVQIEDLYHANSDSTMITQFYYVAETVSALQTSALIGDKDIAARAQVYASSIDKSYSGPYAKEIFDFAAMHLTVSDTDVDSQDTYSQMSNEDKAIVIDFIEQRYEYYDRIADTYSGDKYTNRIWDEASSVFGLSEAQLDIIWYDQSVWDLYRTGQYKFSGVSEPEICLLDVLDFSVLAGAYDGEIASITYRKSDEFSDVATIFQYNEKGQLVRELAANGKNLFDTAYTYYDDGQLSSEIIYWYEVEETDELVQNKTTSHLYEYTYNTEGLIIVKQHIYIKGETTTEEIYEYSYLNGLLQGYTLSKNGEIVEVCTFSYFDNGLVSSENGQNPTGTSSTEVTYSYDSSGHIIEMVKLATTTSSSKQYTTTYVYNQLGLVAEMHEHNSSVDFVTISIYEYDPSGRLIKETINHDEEYATSYTYTYYDIK